MKVTQALSGTSDHRYYIGIDGVTYKVPFRYNRLMCLVPNGLKTLWDLKIGDSVSNIKVQKVIWEQKEYLILKSVDTI
jgi:hypothetical protein